MLYELYVFNDPITHIFYVNHKWPIMKALVYHGPRNVQIDDKPGPSTQHPQDAILRVTSTAIWTLTCVS